MGESFAACLEEIAAAAEARSVLSRRKQPVAHSSATQVSSRDESSAEAAAEAASLAIGSCAS